MRIEGRRYRDEWIPNWYPAKAFGNHLVRVSRAGKTVVLTPDEEAQLNELYMPEELFARLEQTGHIITPHNANKVFVDLKSWLKGTYEGPGLHIVVTTRRCNLSCTYCHMNPQTMDTDRALADLNGETIPRIARFIMSSPRPKLIVEFQGGEPFLNFDAIAGMVRELEHLNIEGAKELQFAVVSNLMVVRDEHLEYCHKKKIRISYSLNGPQPLHDLFRITPNGSGSHAIVMRRVEDINRRYPGLLGGYPLCVLTDDNAPHLIEMADYYFSLGFKELGLIHLKHLGHARSGPRLNIQKFIPHYYNLLEYLYSKNAASSVGVGYSERVAKLALTKILAPSNPPFVDWRNPIGYFTNCVVYDTDGEILPVDEARSMRDVFSLGNVATTSYDELIRKRSTFQTVNLSIRDRDSECRECTYNPYCGVSPVLNYAKTGSLVPRPHANDECTLVLAVFDWIFNKLMNGDPLPLLKMVPEYMSALVRMERSAKKSPAGMQSCSSSGNAAAI